MILVRSQHNNDCGVCALACLTEQPYDRAWAAILAGRVARRLKGDQQTSGYPTSGADLLLAAQTLGWPSVQKKPTALRPDHITPWEDLGSRLAPDRRMIVRVQYQNARRSHWVAFDGKMVYDSGWDCPVTAGRTYTLAPLSFLIFTKAPQVCDHGKPIQEPCRYCDYMGP